MDWQHYYTPPTLNIWQGRTDLPEDASIFQIIKPLDLRGPIPSAETGAFALLGFCCDEGVRRNQGRIGAAKGPTAIREKLAKLAVQKNMVIYDAGNVHCDDRELEKAQTVLSEAVALIHAHQMIPIVLGGGHEVAFGHFQGIEESVGSGRLAIVNFDAHFDMRPLRDQQGNSGTPFLQIAERLALKKLPFHYYCIGIQRASNIRALFETAEHYQVKTLLADDIHIGDQARSQIFVQEIIDHHDAIYLTLCLDVIAAPYAPGVSAPQPLGLIPWQIIPLLRQLAASGKVISYDIAELAPEYDKDDRTARLAANFIYEFIHHHHF